MTRSFAAPSGRRKVNSPLMFVEPIARQVVCLLGTSPRSRKPERIAIVRGKVVELWKAGIEASNRLASDGGENAGKAKAFADTRVKSLSLLLGMIDANAIPAASEWKEWGERNREAARLWEEIAKK